MIILAHRGYWKKLSERNTEEALKKAFSKGYGIESDIRDYDGKLVISHDPANKNCMAAEELFKELTKYDNKLCFAINIKADGLGEELSKGLRHGINKTLEQVEEKINYEEFYNYIKHLVKNGNVDNETIRRKIEELERRK